MSSGGLVRQPASSGLRGPGQSPAPHAPAADQEAVLRILKLDPRNPETQALMLVAGRYDLDPILGHLCLVNGTVMIRKNGLLHLAHRSGDHDGHEVDVEEREDRFVATARVFRKSMSRPVTFTDECMKSERVQSPRKRARTRALRNALAEAYDVAVPVDDEDDTTRPLPRLPAPVVDALPGLPVAEPSFGGRPVEDVPLSPGEGAEGVTTVDDTAPSPGLPAKAKALMAKFAALATPEDVRHELIGWATKGRSQSVKDVGDDEASALHDALHQIKRGTLPDGLPPVVVGWFERR